MTWRLPPIQEVSSVILPHELEDLIDWGQKLVGLPTAWKQTRGQGIDIAVLDTGCDLRHPDLQDAILATKDFTGSRFGVSDVHGHGTHCASVIAARADGRGIRGGASASKLLIGKVLGDAGAGSDQSVAAGINWAARQGADVISLSLGSTVSSKTIHNAIINATEQGCFVICAAGNSGRQDDVNYPGRWSETIAVAAVDEDGRVARYSSRGPQIDIAAPGSNILGAAPGGGYVRMSGTSMAAPLVAAVVALTLSRHKQLGANAATPISSIADLRNELARTARDAGAPGKDNEYGFGLIQPATMLSQIVDDESPVTIELCGGMTLQLPGKHEHTASSLRAMLSSWRRQLAATQARRVS